MLFFGRFRAETLADKQFLGELWASIWMQAEWLSTHLEHHLLGNHLMENAAALALAGSCFEGHDAQRWLETGCGILREQAQEQILKDGLHFERSPMYHARITHLFLNLIDSGNDRLRTLLNPAVPGMLGSLSTLCHPDGRIALLNDSAFGITNEADEILGHAAMLGFKRPDPGFGPWALPEAGYYGYRGADGTYVVCDAGPIGPDYNPGHAHADTFSCELSVFGRRVVVDSGVHGYEEDDMRRYCRSTRAHNTVEIEGKDQSEMWGAFRVARRARVHDVSWKPSPDGFTLSAGHDGYVRLRGRPVHRREFRFQASLGLAVKDQVRSSRPVSCRSVLHLHPDCSCSLRGDKAAELEFPGGKCEVEFTGKGKLEIVEGWYCMEFGIRQANKALVFSWNSAESPETGFGIRL